MKWVTAGKATGTLNRRENSFHIHLPPVLPKLQWNLLGPQVGFSLNLIQIDVLDHMLPGVTMISIMIQVNIN